MGLRRNPEHRKTKSKVPSRRQEQQENEPMWGMPAIASFPPPSGAAQAGMELPKTVIRVGEQSLWSAYSYADNAAVAGVDRRTSPPPLGRCVRGLAARLSTPDTNRRGAGRIAPGQAYDVYGVAL